MSGGHEHASAISAPDRHRRPLGFALSPTAAHTVVEVAVGLAVESLVLLSDAGRMLTGVAGLGEELRVEHVTLQVEAAGTAPHEKLVV